MLSRGNNKAYCKYVPAICNVTAHSDSSEYVAILNEIKVTKVPCEQYYRFICIAITCDCEITTYVYQIGIIHT